MGGLRGELELGELEPGELEPGELQFVGLELPIPLSPPLHSWGSLVEEPSPQTTCSRVEQRQLDLDRRRHWNCRRIRSSRQTQVLSERPAGRLLS